MYDHDQVEAFLALQPRAPVNCEIDRPPVSVDIERQRLQLDGIVAVFLESVS